VDDGFVSTQALPFTETAMTAVMHSLTEFADQLRSSALRLTLSSEWLRATFRDRALRLLFLFLMALTVYLPLSIFFPLWVLIVGPILWGLPHIFASIRYIHRTASDRGEEKQARAPVFRFVTGIWGAVTIFRILTDMDYLSIPFLPAGSELPEVASMIVAFLGCAYLYRKRPRRIAVGLLWVAPLVLASWAAPLWMAGAMVLLHNVVAFVYWYFAARSRREKRVAAFAFGLFLAANALIFAGCFDWLYSWYLPAAAVPKAQLDYSQLGKFIAPWSDNNEVWFHCVVAYALGQALHYFVWLKAIPDQHHHSEVPTSFRQSYRLFVSDFGPALALRIVVICGAALATWAFLSLPMARTLYFAAAACHGYLEIAGLGLATARGRA
jgi:hypothetical protein